MSFPVPTRIRRTALAVVAAALAVPAVASAACPTTATTQTFKPWGDWAQYSLLSGASFESGTSGWTLSNATRVSGNEPWKVGGSTHAYSLNIKAGGSAVSPWFCVGYENPTFRFFTKKNSNGTWGGITYKVRFYNSSGALQTNTLGWVDAWSATSWSPTAILPLGASMPLWQGGGTLNAQLVFESAAGGSDMLVDDIYIDPYMRG